MVEAREKGKKVWLSKPIGEKLEEAGLISQYQIEVALMDQTCYFDTKFGEILALRGWLKQETADFFAQEIPRLIEQPQSIRLGDYFKAAALLEEEQITEILREQIQLGIKFGYIAVLKGYVKQETLDFFLKHLVTEKIDHETVFNSKETFIQFQTEFNMSEDEIPWID